MSGSYSVQGDRPVREIIISFNLNSTTHAVFTDCFSQFVLLFTANWSIVGHRVQNLIMKLERSGEVKTKIFDVEDSEVIIFFICEFRYGNSNSSALS
jgi:hypothetical protein